MNFQQALSHMPHSGPMRLIDQIVSADERAIQCLAVDHNDTKFPLRLEGVLFTATLVELGAQAAAAHASLFTMRQNHTGLLVALQNLVPSRPCVEDIPGPLTIHADQRHADANGSIYRFRVTAGDIDLLSSQVTLKMKGTQE